MARCICNLALLILGMLILPVHLLSNESKSSMNIQNEFSNNWELFSSSKTDASGRQISDSGFNVESYRLNLPKTVMAALVESGEYPDIFFSDNLKKVDESRFSVPWWYRKTFTIDKKQDNNFYQLVFEGLNYKANIWLNGTLIGSSDSIEGCYQMFNFEINELLRDGENVLAVEVIPPKTGDLTIGFVDWNPLPPDQNMGLWRTVKLVKTGKIRIDNVFVKPDLNTETLDRAELDVYANLTNVSDEKVETEVLISYENRQLKKKVKLAAKEKQVVHFSPEVFSELIIEKPRIWWPNNMGTPELYSMEVSVNANEKLSDSQRLRFGIRDVEDYFNEQGHRGYKINGREVLIKGAGWTDDIFLNASDEKV